jgi:hypothetical protein
VPGSLASTAALRVRLDAAAQTNHRLKQEPCAWHSWAKMRSSFELLDATSRGIRH